MTVQKHASAQLQDDLPHIYAADATDIGVLQQLRFQDLDAVIVSVGGSMEASILVTLNLQEVGARRLYVKAVSNEHRKVLNRLGVDYVIQPEHGRGHAAGPPAGQPGHAGPAALWRRGCCCRNSQWTAGREKPLLDLKLSNESGVMVVAIRYIGEREYTFVPSADRPLVKGDIMVVIGKGGRRGAAEALTPSFFPAAGRYDRQVHVRLPFVLHRRTRKPARVGTKTAAQPAASLSRQETDMNTLIINLTRFGDLLQTPARHLRPHSTRAPRQSGVSGKFCSGHGHAASCGSGGTRCPARACFRLWNQDGTAD